MSETMVRAILDAPGAYRLEQIPVPDVTVGHVRLRVLASGICGSDLHTFLGENPAAQTPLAPGHEFSGVVDAVGAGVDHVAAGDLVAARPSVPCGACFYCEAGDEHLCSDMKFVGGLTYDGAFAQYVILPGSCVYPVGADVRSDVVAFAEPTAVAVHTVRLPGDVAGKSVLVLGSGTIGLLITQVALLSGARVSVTDLVAEKVALAESFGATRADFLDDAQAFQASGTDRPFDVVFDCVGSNSTLALSMNSVKKGGTVVLVGVPAGPIVLDPLAVLLGERRLIGSYIYRDDDFEEALALILSKAVQIEPLVSAHLPLQSIAQAFDLAVSGNERIKLVLEPWSLDTKE